MSWYCGSEVNAILPIMTKHGLDLLVSLEGLRLTAYLDSGGKPTIGIGSTYYENGTPVKMGDTITSEEAFRLCESLIKTEYEPAVRDNLKVELNPFQIDALICLCYNIGVTAFKNSTVLRLINSGTANRADIEKAWRMWRLVGNTISQGLVNRREREIQHYYLQFESVPVVAAQAPTSMQEDIPMTSKDKLAFLHSPRFWAMLLLAAFQVLSNEGIISQGILEGIQMLLGGFIGVRTLDRTVELVSNKK